MLEKIAEGRTDLAFDYVKKGHPPSSKTSDGTSLIRWCGYYGDVSAISGVDEPMVDTSAYLRRPVWVRSALP